MAGTEESRREKKIATAPKKEEDEDDSNLFLPSDEFSDSAGSEEERSSTSEKQNAGRTIDANRSSGRPKTSTPRRSKRSNFGNRYEQAISKEKEDASGAPVRNAILGSGNDWGSDDDESEEDDTDFNPEAFQNGKDDKHDRTDDDSESSSSDEDESNAANNNTEQAKKPPRGRKELLSSLIEQKRSIDDMLDDLASSAGLDGVKICCICLWDEYDMEEDAVVQCDSCGVPVHEACYGVLGKELEEVHAKDSDAQSSTETMPWFCDPCRFGERDPVCVACPNRFGAFKQTVKGDWIHSVCARYIKEIYFQDEKRVSDVVTSSVPHSRWAERPCVVCEDIYAKTAGITIHCETGMCKKSLHATCAMLVGSAAEMEPELGFPLAVYCPDHMPKEDKVSNRRCFLASLGIQRKHQTALKTIDADERERLLIAEKKQREMYVKHREENNLVRELKPSVRPLHAAHSLIMKGHARSEALGHFSKPVVNPNPSVENLHFSRPDFRPEFVAYVHKREKMIVDYLERLEAAQAKRVQFTTTKNASGANKSRSVMKRAQTEYRAIKSSFSDILSPFAAFVDKRYLNGAFPALDEESGSVAKGEAGLSTPRAKLVACKICSSSSFPQRMVQCDDCRARFHLKCLDPPLTTMPNKRGVKWLCSDCVPTEEDTEEESVNADTNEKRKRRTLQGKNPLREKRDEVVAPAAPASGQKRRGRKPGFRPQKKVKPEESQREGGTVKEEPHSSTLTAPASSQSHTSRASKGRKRNVEEDKSGVCVKCHGGCTNKNAVECDKCQDWYHFASCLIPPCKCQGTSKFE